MLRIVAFTLQGLLLAFLAYELVVAAWGLREPRRPRSAGRRQRFRVVVPAHNEAAVVGDLLGDIAAQDYPSHLIRTVVVADRCDDDTAAIAARTAEVAERTDGPVGKGAALDWHLSADPLAAEEALVVFDADNRVPAEALGRIADELAAGSEVCQLYLGVENPSGSPVATASALTYWAGNRMVQLARHNLGWSADLGGTGMAFSAAAAATAGPFGDTVAEDQAALARVVIAGHRVRWIHDVRLADEKPESVGPAMRQRARWAAGRRAVARRYSAALVRSAWRQRSWAPVDVAIRLNQPGRSFLALVVVALAVAAVWAGGFLFPWWLWTGAAAVTVMAPVAFLVADRVPARYVARYPLVTLIAMAWVPIRIMSRLGGGSWRRTPRRAHRS